VLVFLLYHNGMSIVQALVQQERLSFGVGVWLTHAWRRRWWCCSLHAASTAALDPALADPAPGDAVKTLRRYLTREWCGPPAS